VAKILLIEDDKELAERVKTFLESESHLVEISGSAEDALLLLKSYAYDLIILDWTLPGMSGIDLLRESGSVRSKTPVLMLTGRDGVADVELGLDSGAADYVRKPFQLRELSARIRAMLRREAPTDEHGTLTFKWITLDPRTKRVHKDGDPVKLQPQEFALLEFFMRHPKDLFSLEALMNSVWPSQIEATPDTVRVCITRLRNKVDKTEEPSLIKTVHRVGYGLDS